MRWLAGGLVLLLTVVCTQGFCLTLPANLLMGLGLAILIYNGGLAFLLSKASASPHVDRAVQHIAILQIVLDWLSMTLFLHLTGGIASPAIPILLIHILMVAVLLPNQSPYLYAVIGTGILVGIAVLEAVGLVSHIRVIAQIPSDLYQSSVYIVAQVTFFAITALSAVYFTTMVMDRLRERERQVTALLETMESATSSLDPDEVLPAFARSVAQALGQERASVRVLDESGERLAINAAYGLSEPYLQKGPVDVEHSRLDQEVLGGQPVIIADAAGDSRLQYPREAIAEGIRSILAVPIEGRRGIVGVLRVYSEQPSRFTSDDAKFAMLLAREAASALENAQAHNALRQSEEDRAQFVRAITHELRAPVAATQSLLRTLLKSSAGTLTDQQLDILKRVEGRLDGLMALIEDLLKLAASSTSGFQGQPGWIPVRWVLQQVIQRIEPMAEEKGIRLICDAPGEPMSVIATEDGLQSVFDNLIGNAVKYTPEGGQVSVHLVERTGQAVITVEDTGIGIPSDDLAHLAEPFHRAKNAKASKIPGTGLGLTIVKRLVESYGGAISVRSVEGRGTTFRITLPLAGGASPE